MQGGNRTLVISLEGSWKTVSDQKEVETFSVPEAGYLGRKLTLKMRSIAVALVTYKLLKKFQ